MNISFLVALQALKRKKRYEAQLTQIDGTLTSLEYQRESLENATTNAEVLKTMKTAADAFKQANQNMKIEDVEELKDDIAEQQNLADEISKVISSPMGNDIFDDEDLLNELEELEQETLEEELTKVPTTNPLPNVPDEPIAGNYSKRKLYKIKKLKIKFYYIIARPGSSKVDKSAMGKVNRPVSGKKDKELNELLDWASN